MKRKSPLLLILLVGIFGSTHESPRRFRSNSNSTFLTDKQRYRPEAVKAENIIGESFPPQESSEEHSPEVRLNPQKFSSRYSTKRALKDGGREEPEESQLKTLEDTVKSVDITSRSDNIPESGEEKLLSDRLDVLNSREEETEDERHFDANEPEESEIAPTNEPYHSPNSASLYNGAYLEFGNYGGEKNAEGEEKSADFRDSGSKNYHSVQTPLGKIKYRGPHSFDDGFEPSTEISTLTTPIVHWPYSAAAVNGEEENEISESDNSLEEEIKEELKGNPSHGLESAVEKDESKFGRNTKYNHLKERNRGEQNLKSITAEEEKDHRLPFQTNNQYEVEEDHYPKKSPVKLHPSGIWSSVSPISKNIFKNQPEQSTKQDFDISPKPVPKFQNQQYLGPVIFSHDLSADRRKFPLRSGRLFRTKPATSRVLVENLLEREKLDQENLNNLNIQKTISETGSVVQSFNHLEESEQMYNAILANIQSVFGLRTQALKTSGSRNSEVDLEESRSLTWSLPLSKGLKVE